MAITGADLKHFDLFEAFKEEELAVIASLCREESYEEGAIVFVEDAPARRFYLVIEGKVSLEKKVQLGRSGSARRAVTSILGPGQIMGWSSLIAPYTYTSTSVCMEPSKMIAIESQALRFLMSQDPAAGLKLMDAIARSIKGRLQGVTATMSYFLSIISHELKSPLAAIENYLQIMLDGFAGELTDKQTRMLQRSALRINELRGLINDILDLARMRPEQVQADFVKVDIKEICAEAVEDVRLMAAEKGIQLHVEAPARFRELVGAPRRLRQVFSNLLSNAVKFSPEGSTVTFRMSDEPGRLVVEVIDEGIGIPTGDRPYLFEDFFRGAAAQDTGGSGLGLAIAKKIVDAHHGAISVESPYAEGKPGSKFTVAIPRALPLPGVRRSYDISCPIDGPRGSD
jgi:signal transduction histidine kinase